jgi:hypothetical protein
LPRRSSARFSLTGSGSEIYFDPGIRARTRAYLEAARRFAAIIKSEPPDLQRDLARTDIPLIDSTKMNELSEAFTRAEESRETLMAEVRANIGGDSL